MSLHEERRDYLVDLYLISTPRERCLLMHTGAIDEEILRAAETARFDQLPVIDETGILCGLVATIEVKRLREEGRDISDTETPLHFFEVESRPPLMVLLKALEQHRAIIFRSAEPQAGDWFALVTISDLNRHPFRSHLYPIVAELEEALAKLIVSTYDDPWTWLAWTGEEAQVRHIGRWELEKRKGVDTSPITGCTLPDLINIVGKSTEILEELGIKSRSRFKALTSGFAVVRNQIMHPVRPLILDQNDVRSLQSIVGNIVNLTSMVDELNSETSAQVHATVHIQP